MTEEARTMRLSILETSARAGTNAEQVYGKQRVLDVIIDAEITIL